MPTTDKLISRTKFLVLKALARGLVTAHPKTWTWTMRDPGDKTSRAGTTVTSTMRALIEDGLVSVLPDLVDGRRHARITQTGYTELSRAGHAYTGKKAKKK